jgi:hypothetical protein
VALSDAERLAHEAEQNAKTRGQGGAGGTGGTGGTGATTATSSQTRGSSNTSIERHGIGEVEGTHSTDGVGSDEPFSGLINPSDIFSDAALWAFDTNNMAFEHASAIFEPTTIGINHTATPFHPGSLVLDSPAMSFDAFPMSASETNLAFDSDHFIVEQNQLYRDLEGQFDDL